MSHATDRPPHALAPYLFYDDVARAARFLEEAFGFTRIFESPAPEGGLAHAQLAHETGKVMLGQTGRGLRLVKSAGSMDALHAGVYVTSTTSTRIVNGREPRARAFSSNRPISTGATRCIVQSIPRGNFDVRQDPRA